MLKNAVTMTSIISAIALKSTAVFLRIPCGSRTETGREQEKAYEEKCCRGKKITLSHIITLLVVTLVSIIIISAAFAFLSIYVSSMEESAMTSSEQAVVQVSNAVGNYIDDMKEIMTIIEQSYELGKEDGRMR